MRAVVKTAEDGFLAEMEQGGGDDGLSPGPAVSGRPATAVGPTLPGTKGTVGFLAFPGGKRPLDPFDFADTPG